MIVIKIVSTFAYNYTNIYFMEELKEYLEENGEQILDVLGLGAPRRIAEKTKQLFDRKVDGQTVGLILKNKENPTHKISMQLKRIVTYSAIEVIRDRHKEESKILLKYESTNLQAA